MTIKEIMNLLEFKKASEYYYVLSFNEGFFEVYDRNGTRHFYYYKNGKSFRSVIFALDLNYKGDLNNFISVLSTYSDEFKLYGLKKIRSYKLKSLLL